MKNLKSKILFILFLAISIAILSCKITYAASMNMSISKTSGYIGDTFSVTISGVNGKVYISSNSNISIDKSGNQFVDGSLTITGTAKSVGTGTITVTPVDVTTTAAEPEEVTAVASRSITIKEKEVENPKPETTTKQQTVSKPTTSKNSQVKTSSKNNNQKESTKKSEDFYINKLILNGINEKDEYVEIEMTPEFNKDVYEYECKIASDIKKIEIEKDAGEFTDSIVITGLDEIKEGENIIKVELAEEGYETRTYTIKVIKDKQESNEVEEQADLKEVKEERKTTIVSMPLYVLIIMVTLIIIIEAVLMWILDKKLKNKTN